MKRQTIWLLIVAIVLIFLATSCASIGKGCPSNVSHWERTHKFNK